MHNQAVDGNLGQDNSLIQPELAFPASRPSSQPQAQGGSSLTPHAGDTIGSASLLHLLILIAVLEILLSLNKDVFPIPL
jgi:hypothetical protein